MPVSTADFKYVRQLVQDDSALSLSDDKEYLVESRLDPLVKRAGLDSLGDLIDQLRTGTPGLRQHVVEALATHETQFFRDLHPFETLRQEIIPSLLQADGDRRLAMWSAASSGGQEAYSLALLMRESFPDVGVSILATDISRKVLAQAKLGMFTQLEVNRGLPVALLVKHFDRVGRDWQLHDDVPQHGHLPPAQPRRAAVGGSSDGCRVPAQCADLLQRRGEDCPAGTCRQGAARWWLPDVGRRRDHLRTR